MNRPEIISKAVKCLHDGYYDYAIVDMLNAENIPLSEHEAIINEARIVYISERAVKLKRRHTILFGVFSMAFLVTLYLFLFSFPYKVESDSTFLSIVGAILLAIFGSLIYYYFNSWSPEAIAKYDERSFSWISMGFIMILPIVILSFMISARFSNVADSILMKNHVDVKGRVVNGFEREIRSLRRSIKTKTIIVEFTTAQGNRMTVSEDVANLEKYYLGMPIDVIYSKTNPNNFELLTSDDKVRKFKNSSERELLPDDLIYLLNQDQEEPIDFLNRISSGWIYNEKERMWFNERKNMAVFLSGQTAGLLTTSVANTHLNLKKSGFKRIIEDGQKIVTGFELRGNYENDKYIVSIVPISEPNTQPTIMLTIRPKMDNVDSTVPTNME